MHSWHLWRACLLVCGCPSLSSHVSPHDQGQRGKSGSRLAWHGGIIHHQWLCAYHLGTSQSPLLYSSGSWHISMYIWKGQRLSSYHDTNLNYAILWQQSKLTIIFVLYQSFTYRKHFCYLYFQQYDVQSVWMQFSFRCAKISDLFILVLFITSKLIKKLQNKRKMCFVTLYHS